MGNVWGTYDGDNADHGGAGAGKHTEQKVNSHAQRKPARNVVGFVKEAQQSDTQRTDAGQDACEPNDAVVDCVWKQEERAWEAARAHRRCQCSVEMSMKRRTIRSL